MENEKEIKTKVKELSPWFHNIHLPGGIQTVPEHPLGDFPATKWKDIAPHLPADLTNHRVLDIGCNAGYYSIECAKRGARVTSIDVDLHYLDQAEWVADVFGLKNRIDLHHMQVYDLVHMDWKFDIILYMGVFYHLRYPVLATDIISEKTDGLLVFQSLSLGVADEHEPVVDFDFSGLEMMQQKYWPSMSFIENNFLGDPTNWWVPNPAGIKAIFRTAGFRFLHSPGHEIYFFESEPGKKSVIHDWNHSEFLSATGREWKMAVEEKTGSKSITHKSGT
jgi:tRNA (mo5U34)-methyltransferase